MLIEVELSVIDNTEEYRNLDRLLLLFEEEQHEWYIEDKVEDLMLAGWASQLSERHKKILSEIVEKSIVRTANISKAEKLARGILKIDNSPNTSLSDVLPSIIDPLYIVVENETSDSLFLNRLYSIYPNPGHRLTKAKNQQHLDYYPAGGRGETIKTVTNLLQKKPAPYRPRILVFVDSDKKFPEQEHDVSLQKIVDFCMEKGVSLHILYKREIENYIPASVLEKRIPAALSNVLEEVLKLTPEQLDFYDLEKGFREKRPSADDKLFGEFAEKDNKGYIHLKSGLHLAKEFIAKQELYKFVDDNDFNADSVSLRCEHQPEKNELLNLLNKIANKL